MNFTRTYRKLHIAYFILPNSHFADLCNKLSLVPQHWLYMAQPYAGHDLCSFNLKHKARIQKLLSATDYLHLSSASFEGTQEPTPALSYVWIYLFVVTFFSFQSGRSARTSPASSAPHQEHAWLGVLSTQVVFEEPADLKILYLSRHWFGPCSPAVLAGGSPTAFTTMWPFEGSRVNSVGGRTDGGAG